MKFPKPRPKKLVKREEDNQALRNWRHVRTLVLNRDKGQCRICRKAPAFDVHHLLPRSLGGKHEKRNLILVCRQCHSDIHGHIIYVRWSNDDDRAGSMRVQRIA